MFELIVCGLIFLSLVGLLDDTETKESISYIETCINRQVSEENRLDFLQIAGSKADHRSYDLTKTAYDRTNFSRIHLFTFLTLF